ncbi:MAG: hypothetical protein K6U77_12970 [Armatimonadetes bacterium]|nr:hypothetical protein [Armatimonadota bacterium]
MRQPPIVQEILETNDIDTLLDRLPDVGEACAMARWGDAEPRALLKHLLNLAESYQGDPSLRSWLILVGLIDVLADEVRNSVKPDDLSMVRRTDALFAAAYKHHGAGHANRSIEDDES